MNDHPALVFLGLAAVLTACSAPAPRSDSELNALASTAQRCQQLADINQLNRQGMSHLEAVLQELPDNAPQRTDLVTSLDEYREVTAQQEAYYRHRCPLDFDEFGVRYHGTDSGVAKHINRVSAERNR